MSANYEILTDSSCDLSCAMARDLGIVSVPLCVNIDGQDKRNMLRGDPAAELEMTDFYDRLRQGACTSTTAANPELWGSAMEKMLQAGKDVLVLAFSSGLSGTYASAVIAAQELRAAYPERKILVVDTLCASRGQGMLVYHVAQKRQQGAALEEAAQWAEENKLRLCHWFTVDDLMFLKRGGRISTTTAVAGALLKIKPVMHMDNEGRLVSMSKARGRKAAIEAIAAKVGELGIDPGEQTMFICHGDCPEDAAYLARLVKEQYHPRDVLIDYVGPVIGSHSGPGTLALFFFGRER